MGSIFRRYTLLHGLEKSCYLLLDMLIVDCSMINYFLRYIKYSTTNSFYIKSRVFSIQLQIQCFCSFYFMIIIPFFIAIVPTYILRIKKRKCQYNSQVRNVQIQFSHESRFILFDRMIIDLFVGKSRKSFHQTLHTCKTLFISIRIFASSNETDIKKSIFFPF